MNAKEFSAALGNVRNEYVTEAVTYRNKRKYCDENIVKGVRKPMKNTKKTAWVKWGTMAACICVALIGTVTFLNKGTQDQLIEEEPPVGSSDTIPDFSNPAEEIHLYYYSELAGIDNAVNKDICAQFAASAVDVEAFNESMLEDCAAVIEGEIVNIHLKNYTFTTVEDKYDKGGTLEYNVSTVVYEIKVAKVWYGGLTVGDIVTVEDQFFFADEALTIKNGHSYVIPIYEAGNEIWSFGHKELLSGDIQRDSIYSTVYPHHPQIEAVEDGYIVSTDWETLIDGEKSDIIMDIELGENGNFYKDKMMFIPTEAFSEQMDILIEGILAESAPFSITGVTTEADNSLISFTEEEIGEAKQAALAYYDDTVFTVNSIEYFNGDLPYGGDEDCCNFTVNVSKDGVMQEPDRTISLKLDNGIWKVVNEGY